MPGQLSDGISTTREWSVVNSKAFCEGRQAKAWTQPTNPHPTGSEANAAWAAGYALTAASGVQGPCNITPGITVPNVVGQTQAAATATLVAAGLVLGVVTLTTGNVTVQSPVAAAVVMPRTAVNITLTS